MGEDYVDYPEFEFWFLRFLQGNFELDYDRSSDPKARPFIELPLDIFNNIGEYLRLEDRFQLRNVCKDIRYQVDDWDLKVDEIYYNNTKDWMFYLKSSFKLYSPRSIRPSNNNIFCPGLAWKPMSFLMNLLSLPKLQVEKLTIHKQDEYWGKFIKKLDESNRKLPVKKFHVEYNRSSTIDLHFMIPGVLEEIKMILSNPNLKEFYAVIKSEQCQSAKMVYIRSWKVTSNSLLEALYNCPRFTLRTGGGPEDSLIINFLKRLMENGKVQICVLYLSTYLGAPSQILKYFNEPEAMVPDFPSLRRYPIPNTNDFYELEYRVEFRERSVRLERKVFFLRKQ